MEAQQIDFFDFYRAPETHEDAGTWASFEALDEHLSAIVEDSDHVQHVRWSGIPDDADPEDVLPYVSELTVSVSRHWHDGVPKIRIFGNREASADTLEAVYLWGIVYESAGPSGPDEWDAMHHLAGKLRGGLTANGTRYKHPNE